MNKGIIGFIVVVLMVSALIAGGAFYIIDETQQSVLTQFGKLVGTPKREAGLYFKIPFIQKVNYFEKRIMEWDGDAAQIPTLDKRLIWVDTTARWQIVDPLKFMKRVRMEAAAQSRLDDIIDAKTREIMSSNMLIEAIRTSNRLISILKAEDVDSIDSTLGKTALEPIKVGRENLSGMIRKKSKEALLDYGINIIDVKIKRINYVREVELKVFERMVSERKRAAEQFRSEGQGKKAEIEGQMSKELQEIRAGAYKRAQEIKGKADATSIKIYADAYNKDPEFYAFLRTLETYKNTINKDTTFILTTDNDLYEYVNSAKE